MKLFDAHCHIQSPDAVRRAAAVGVTGIAICGTSPDDWAQVFQTLETSSQIYPSIGIHPWFCSKDWKKSFQTLEKMLTDFPMSGIGETGLDFSPRFGNRAEQEACFAAHLDLARELNRPVVVHCVQAWGRLIEIMKAHPAPKILLHAYGGAPELVPQLSALNCRFSFGGAVLNLNAKKVRASAAAVPAGRILIESDSVDESQILIDVARAVAQLRGVSVEDVARSTTEAAFEFFGTI